MRLSTERKFWHCPRRSPLSAPRVSARRRASGKPSLPAWVQADSRAAMALSLLLLLKRYLKMAYALPDDRCAAFSPTDPARTAEPAAPRDGVGPFDAALLPLQPVAGSRDLWQRYKVRASTGCANRGRMWGSGDRPGGTESHDIQMRSFAS